MSSDTHSPTAVPSTGMTVQRWEKIATPWIVLSALIPIVGMAAGKTEGGIVAVIGIACWLVFLVDLIVHMRLSPGYLHTTSGKVDLAIVVLTCPWYLFVGASAGGFVTIARMARLVRVVWVAMRNSKARQLMQRIGQAGIYAGGLLVACSLIVKWVEPESSGYATYGDAFWWGFVTLTTVGTATSTRSPPSVALQPFASCSAASHFSVFWQEPWLPSSVSVQDAVRK